MIRDAYQYNFDKTVDIAETEATLLVAMIATEGLHGTSAVRMHGRYQFDPKRRVCEIDASSEVGQDLNRIYLQFLNREFGPRSFTVERVSLEPASA